MSSDRSSGYLDRPIDFYRPRHTACGSCGHRQVFGLGWFDRWSQGRERCPGCGVDCTEVKATRVDVDPDDPALDDAQVAALAWWHTSTHPDWPSLDYDPAAGLDQSLIHRMGGPDKVANWAARQRGKALHVGTYESAIHNMLRRMRDQPEPEPNVKFYLYRVQLRPDVVVKPGCGREVVDWMGDVPLLKACPPGIDVTRYVNEHEDPGGISLALGRPAIRAVQRVAIPLVPAERPDWVEDAITRLDHAAAQPVPTRPEPSTWRERLAAGSWTDPVRAAKREIAREVAAHPPVNIRDLMVDAARGFETADSNDWCDYLAGLVRLVDQPDSVMHEAQRQVVTEVC